MRRKLTALVILVLMGTVTTPIVADAKMGQKIFKKKFRKKCRFSGVKFARHHTQGEWEELWDNDKFQKEAKRICPKLDLKKIKPSWWEHVYDFSYKYASDGVVPKC